MRPCASRRTTDAAHVCPGASGVHDACTPPADARENETPTQDAAALAETTCIGVRGSGFTSPVAPTTDTVHDEPAASEQRADAVPPWGSVLGAAPTRSDRRAGATPGWLVIDTTAASSAPGTAVSAPVTVRIVPFSTTPNDEPGGAMEYATCSQSVRPCHVVIVLRSYVAVSPGPTTIAAARSSGCGARARMRIGTDR